MEPPRYYRKYTSFSESESESEYDSESDISSQASFTNDVGNFADLARNLLRRDIGGDNLNSLSTMTYYSEDRNFSVYDSAIDTIAHDLSANNIYLIPPQNTIVTEKVQQTSIINLDSTNRDKSVYPQPTNLNLRLPRTYRSILNFQIIQIKLLSAFYYFRNSKNNISISINEQSRYLDSNGNVVIGSDVTNPNFVKTLNIITNKIREGSYDINSLINELTIQLNTAPIFYDFVGGFNQFVPLFASTGDFSLGFNLPGDYYYDSVINDYIANPTIDQIVTKYFQTRYAGLTSYTIDNIKIAYYYPVLKELLLDNNYSGTKIDFTNVDSTLLRPSETPYTRCVYYFQGIFDPYVLSVIQNNVSTLDEYRDKHTFRYSLVNKYDVSYDTFNNRISINSPSLNTSLVNLLNYQQTLYFNEQLNKYGITSNQYTDLFTQNTLLLAVLNTMYDFLQFNFATQFAVPFNTYTLDYYGISSNYIYLRNGSNAIVSSNYDINTITSAKVPISNNIPTYFDTPPKRFWPNLALNASSNFSNNTNISYYNNTPFNLQTDNIETFNLIDSLNTLYSSKLLNHVDCAVNIDNTSYTVLKFKSGVRQTLQVETLPRPTKYRYPEYNSNYSLSLQNYFNNVYTYQYNQSNIALIDPTINVSNVPGFSNLSTSNFGITETQSSNLWNGSNATLSAAQQELYYSFIPPLPDTSNSVAYNYRLNLSIQSTDSNFPSALELFIYRDIGAFYADISGSRNESKYNYLSSNEIPANTSSFSISFTTYQTPSTIQYYTIIRSRSTTPSLTNFIITPYFTDSNYTSLTDSLIGFNPLANPENNFNNFLYSRSYDRNYLALPSYNSLFQQNPLSNSLFSNISYNDVPMGYDTNNVSTDLTTYIGYNSGSNFVPNALLRVDPISLYVARAQTPYNSTNQLYFYAGSSNRLFTSNAASPYTPTTPSFRQYTQVHYYATNYLSNPPSLPPIESKFSSDVIQAYNTSAFSNSLSGYTFDTSNNLILGNGIYGISLIPSQGTWDIQRYMFRSIINQTSWFQSNINNYASDPNLNIKYLGIYYTNVVANKDIQNIRLKDSIATLKYSIHRVYNSSNTDYSFGADGGTFYEFVRDNSFRNDYYSYLYGFTENSNTITTDYNNSYTVLAFDANSNIVPFVGLAGSLVPYPYYSDAIASNAYLDGSAILSNLIVPITKPSPDSNRGPSSNYSQSQSQYEQSMPIGTVFQGYISNSSMYNLSMYGYSNLGMPIDKIIMDISGYMLTIDTQVRLYSYDNSSNRSFTYLASFTLDDVFGNDPNISCVSVAANESEYAFLGLSNSITPYTVNFNNPSPDKLIIKTFNPISRSIQTKLITNFLTFPVEDSEVQSFTYNNSGGFTMGFNYSTIQYAYSLQSSPSESDISISSISTLQTFVSSISGYSGLITYQNPKETTGAFYVANYSSNISEFSYVQPNMMSSNDPNKIIQAFSASNYIFGTSNYCKITSYYINGNTFEQMAFTRSGYDDTIFGFTSSNPNYFYQLTSYSTSSSNKYNSNANFTVSVNPIGSNVKEMEAGYNGSLWFNDFSGTIYGNRYIQQDGLSRTLKLAYQIFYPVQRIVYKNIYKDVNLMSDLSGLQYPEYAHTQLFFYNSTNSFNNDFSNSFGQSPWGNESNYAISDTQFSGYYFNAYSTFIPLESNSDYYYIALRNYSPTEKSQVYLRLSLPNRHDYGYASIKDISNEVLLQSTNPELFNPNYGSNLSNFNKLFVFASKTFGSNVVPGYYGVTLSNVTGFGDFMKYYKSYYNTYLSNVGILNSINSAVNSNLSNFIANDLQYIIPPTATNRQRFTDPLLFSILWESTLPPQFANLEDNWGLGWNLGYIKQDTPYDVIQTATSFYKILDDYIVLRLNNEFDVNRVDTTAKENISATLESTGQTKAYYGKLLLAPFGSYAQTMIMNPISFNPPLGRLDKLTFTWYDVTGNVIDNSDCEWNAVVQIVENMDIARADFNSGILNPR